MIDIAFMNRVDILSPQKSVAIARSIVFENLPMIDRSNVLGLFGIGSFWLPYGGQKPKDIDLVVYAVNDSQFTNEDKPKLAAPFKSTFGLNLETHIFTPYTPMVRHELQYFKSLFENDDYIPLLGQLPEWLL